MAKLSNRVDMLRPKIKISENGWAFIKEKKCEIPLFSLTRTQLADSNYLGLDKETAELKISAEGRLYYRYTFNEDTVWMPTFELTKPQKEKLLSLAA